MESNKQFLHSYLNAFSPVGQESEGQKIWINYVRPYSDAISVDAYGTAYAVKKGLQPTLSHRMGEPYKVVIEAHCDEIAWIVTHIEKEGHLRVWRLGGSDNMIAASKTVLVHTHDGKKFEGVFGSPAVHVRDKYTEMGPEPHELWIDLGYDTDEKVKELGIEVGNIVTFDDQFKEIGDYYVGRSLDNKIGGYIIAEALKKIHVENIKLSYDLYVVNSVQEEVGLYGARLIAQKLKADLALVHDVTHNTATPKMDKAKESDIQGGKGPVMEYTSQNHRKIIQLYREVAKKNEIPVQLSVGSYGNDTVSFFLENTPTAIIASPLKYMHTTVEMVHKKDVEYAIQLFVESLKSINTDFIDDVNNVNGRI